PPLQIRAIVSPRGADPVSGGASFFTTPPTTTTTQLLGTLNSGDGTTQNYLTRISAAINPGGGTNPGAATFVWDNYAPPAGPNVSQIVVATVIADATQTTGLRTVSGSRTVAVSSLAGASPSGQYPLGQNVTGEGIGPAPSIAIDATLGSYSPNRGKIYIAYVDRDFNIGANPGDNSDICMVTLNSPTGGASGPFLVNDDSGAADGYSGAQFIPSLTGRYNKGGVQGDSADGRPQFLPAVAVDQYTGTVGVSYLDTRYDASRIRVVNSVQTSIDGGRTFSASKNANLETAPSNVITGDTVLDIPVPDNQGAANPVRDALWGFGVRSSLQMFAGQIFPAWSFNYNTGYDTNNNSGTNVNMIRGNIAIGRMYTSAGPRVIESTMGAVRSWQAGATTFNNTVDTNGVQQVDGFTFTMDRPVLATSVTDPTFYASNFSVTYTDVYGTQSSIPVTNVTPLNLSNTQATQFFAQFAPQSAVGTYSYSIGPGNIRDAIRTVDALGIVKNGNLMDQDNIPDRITGVDTSYATPAPLNPLLPGAPPYDNATLPLIVSGPYVTGSQLGRYDNGDKTKPVIWNPTSTGELLALNVAPSQISFMAQFIDVTFDRNMDPSTFTTADILEMRGPAGLLDPSKFTITPNPSNTDPDPAFPRTYRIDFPNQRVSGQYSVVLGANIAASTGELMDANKNAGLYVLRGASPSGPTINQSFSSNTSVPIAAATVDPVTQVVTPSVSKLKLTVGESFLINQFANIKINVTFPKDTDLTGYLVAPDGSRTLLFSGVGQAGTGANFTETVFDDTALTPIQNGGAPFFGRFRPQQPLLNNLIGINAKGDWYLEIQNKGTLPVSTGVINSLALNLGKQVPDTGLGEPVADRTTLDFRIFTMNVDNSLAADQWVAVGPAGINNGTNLPSTNNPQLGGSTANSGAGRVSTVAVDPSDTSGNTVYIGAGTGGVFKTTNFLTNDARGPIWQDLTGFGPTNSLNSGTIAIYPRNSDPGQSIVLVGTGEPGMLNPPGYGQTYTPNTAAGVGVLISPDGGKSWKILDSTTNYDAAGNYLPLTSPARDHLFLGSTIQKIVVDPRPTTTGETIIYMAVYNPATPNANGIWKSIDTGRTWQVMRRGVATDIVLDPSSGVVNAISNPSGNLQIAYAAFQGEGVFLTNNRGVSWTLMAGGVGNPLWRSSNANNVNTLNNPSPNGGFGRILLAKPYLTGNATQDLLYSGWLYAVVANTGNNGIQGVYVTKNFGQNWTKIAIRTLVPLGGPRSVPINSNSGTQDYNFGFNESDYAESLTIDPTNPNVIYLGGAFGGIVGGQPESMIRVEISRLSDSNAFYMGNFGDDGGLPMMNTTNIIGLTDPVNNNPSTFPPPPPYDPRIAGFSAYTNMYKDPQKPLANNSSIPVNNVVSIGNAGNGARWVPMGNNPSDISFGNSLLGNF
ncbi:MAG: proprotein convertase P-domain-containing protein, partial [bacterium]